MTGNEGSKNRRRLRRRQEDDVSPAREATEPELAPDEDAEEVQNVEDRRTERLFQHFLSQRELARAARAPSETAVQGGPSNLAKAEVPWAYDVAAAWSWRFLVIFGALAVILYLVSYLAVVVFPVIIALLLAALTAPVVNLLQRIGLPRKLAAFLVVAGGLGLVALLLTFVGQQIADSVDELSGKVAGGLGEVEKWLKTGPLHASDSQVNDWIGNAQDFVTKQGKDVFGRVSELGVAVGHVVAGFFIILFSTYFFLADGAMIWAWIVRMFPRAARERANSSGHVAWHSLTQFVRATVLVAATDALGVMLVAFVLGVPLVGAIGVLVFLGAFIPMIGAFLSGSIAVLVALVAHGPISALIMLAGVVVVQQIEAHILQPFLMGRFVSVHPLGVILAIAAGVVFAGIPGALIAVPLAAALNAVAQHLSSFAETGEDSLDAAVDDPLPVPDSGGDPE